jgi:hypothetical protein
MKIIALTSANETAMAAVAEQLLSASCQRSLRLSVLLGVKDAHQAQAVFTGPDRGELWRIGEDSTHPELDALIDCQIDDSAPLHMARQVRQAVERFLEKSRRAA